jgi:hypothetical protein
VGLFLSFDGVPILSSSSSSSSVGGSAYEVTRVAVLLDFPDDGNGRT